MPCFVRGVFRKGKHRSGERAILTYELEYYETGLTIYVRLASGIDYHGIWQLVPVLYLRAIPIPKRQKVHLLRIL